MVFYCWNLYDGNYDDDVVRMMYFCQPIRASWLDQDEPPTQQ